MKTNGGLLFLLILVSAMLIEGSGIKYGREVGLYVIIVLPLFIFLFRRKKLNLPKNLIFLFLFFSLFSAVSALFSQNIWESFEQIAYYVALAAAFVYAYHDKGRVANYVLPIIFSFSIFFSIYSMFLPPLVKSFPFLEPSWGYQFVFSKFASHNHLGDFLILPLTACFYYLLSKRTQTPNHFSLLTFHFLLLFILFFLPFLLFSYSRSAYITLALTLLIMFLNLIRTRTLKVSPVRITLALFVLFLSGLFLLSVVRTEQITRFSSVTEVLTERNALSYKNPYGNRNEYLRQGLLSIAERPLLGVGPGNFIYASKKFTSSPGFVTESAHNIFVDIFVENGIVAGIAFVLIIFGLFRRSRKNLNFYLALALLLNFQTDYTHRIYSLLLLFFILTGLSHKETKN